MSLLTHQSPIDFPHSDTYLLNSNQVLPAEYSPIDQSTLIHWHVPSEHTVGGKRFPIEMHIVHNVTESKTAVLGILFEHVEIPNPYVDELLRQKGLK